MAHFAPLYNPFTRADHRYYWPPFEMQESVDFVGQRTSDVHRAPSRPDARYQGAHTRYNTSSSSLAFALDDSATRPPPIPPTTHQDIAPVAELSTATSTLDPSSSLSTIADGALYGFEAAQTEYLAESYAPIGEIISCGCEIS